MAFSFISRLNDQSPRSLGALCILILLILLVAGLWPFNFLAKNKVAWLSDQDGVHFYGQGMIESSELPNSEQEPLFLDKSITLEIRLRPLTVTGNLPHILTLHDGKAPDLFFVGQWRSHLIIRSRADNPAMRKKGKGYGEIGLNNALQKDRDCFLTIASGVGGTTIYLNGKLARIYPGYHMLAGATERPLRLVLGNSSSGEGYWSGYLTGLAVYNQVLSIDQVFKSYEAWTANAPLPNATDNGDLGRYLFNERRGTEAHNDIKAIGGTLTLPKIFTPVQRKILYPFWPESRLYWSLLQDIATNIIGFIPFGFFLSVLLSKITRLKCLPACLTTILLGTGLSLMIELTQAYLPTRDSSLMDVFTNSAGTILGAAIFQYLHKQPSSNATPTI